MDWTVTATDTEHDMAAIKERLLGLSAIILIFPAFSQAQVPVDDDGNVVGEVQSGAEIMPLGDDGIPRLSSIELQELVGPVALYPDDLLAVVLPASAYPLQIAAAARFLEARDTDPSLEPDPDWDDAVVALLNYPEVVELLNDDLDWTYRLGEAVVAQQEDVIAAVETFRDRAYAAGNLKSDSYQTVARNDGAIHITPVADDVIYVPYYEPARVVTYQRRPAYYYYPRPCPVYYYPYASDYYFDRGFFWGVTTAFTIGWYSDSLNVWHHSYRGHPYYGRRYWDNWWYRRPTINVYNTTYIDNTVITNNRYRQVRVDHHNRGDRWRARSDRRVAINREGFAGTRHDAVQRIVTDRGEDRRRSRQTTTRQPEQIRFRERAATVTENRVRDDKRPRREATPPREPRQERLQRERATTDRREIRFRDRSAEQRVARTRQPAQQREQRTVPEREQRAAPQRERRVAPQREQRSVPQRTQRAVPQRTQRSAPQRELRTEQRREQQSAPRREQRAAPRREQRSVPQRTQRTAPQRETRRERAAPKRESSGSNAGKREARADDRRSRRRER